MGRAICELSEEFKADLEPNHMAGQNIGEPTDRGLTAGEKAARALTDFRRDELHKIPIVPEGARLEQGATYVDLNNPRRIPFTATGEMSAQPGCWYVPKAEIAYELWNRLVGEEKPPRGH